MALRFAVSPLWETVAALRVLAAPGYFPVHQRWAAWAERRTTDLGEDPTLLTALVTMPVVPEFLIPTPGIRSIGMDEELRWLPRVAKPARIAAALPDVPRFRPLLENHAEALARICDRLAAVHDAIIAPVWSRLEGVLQGDIERRGRRLVEAGGPTVLAELHQDVGYGDAGLDVHGDHVPVGKRDLVLIPSAFIWPDVYLRNSPVRLALCYPAHGFGSLWERSATPVDNALARLIGPTRARLLRELERPSTVSELATRLGVTVGAVSQHLNVLRATGLAVSRREGREVVSLRTGLGLALVRGEVR
ncbi:DNA-binding transcriptional ArsR family regulator [Saccharothrix tamanrassetensis]|uniref:DNA-binding transcriptional ArsR family regulator n=1 Tax=Saccharothrix tamanrassetensis TaxID=1051531 RepID=A0A841CV11_9PSEU|nr:metalloregulator ArsR/SmtB family transcription factor [Saccharothrix tamanrassetensis]MBB5959246.1 DNA-binding transcriptional ArsR family regulator [Saccharothrix tamanrassetensis]